MVKKFALVEDFMYKLAFLIPHYNHHQSIKELIELLKIINENIIVVDDKSSKESIEEIKNINAKIFYRDKNGGKGAAIKDGINFANALGFTHVFQIDADFQHDINSCSKFISLSMKNPNLLIFGHPIYDENVPKVRLQARKITNFWLYINSLGGDIKDGMCGFRIYPIKEILPIINRTKSNRMDFDIEILLRSYRAGIKIIWQEVKVFYKSDGISHFRAFKDNLLISLAHAKLFFSLPIYIFKVIFYGR